MSHFNTDSDLFKVISQNESIRPTRLTYKSAGQGSPSIASAQIEATSCEGSVRKATLFDLRTDVI